MAVNVELNTLFFTEQYKFFEEQEFKIYKTKGNWQHAIDIYCYIHKSKYQQNSQYHKNDYVYSVYGIKDYIDSRKYSDRLYCNSYDPENKRNLNIEFAVEFYNKYPEHQKIILKNLQHYTNHGVKGCYKEFINTLTKDKKETIKLIHNFPISAWETTTVDFKELEEYLGEKGVTTSEFDDFFLKFLKNRKAQLKDVYTGNILKQYLTNRFGSKEENLKPYIELIPVLKADFEAPEIDFFQNETKFSDVLYISGKKMKASFLIDIWQEDKYKEKLFTFCSALKDNYKLKSCFTEVVDKQDQLYEIIFLHNNETVNKDLIKELIVEFFNYLRASPDFEVTKENCANWFLNKQLEEKVNISNETVIKKKKI